MSCEATADGTQSPLIEEMRRQHLHEAGTGTITPRLFHVMVACSFFFAVAVLPYSIPQCSAVQRAHGPFQVLEFTAEISQNLIRSESQRAAAPRSPARVCAAQGCGWRDTSHAQSTLRQHASPC